MSETDRTEADVRPMSRRGLLVFLAAVILAFAVLLSLGIWQVQRLAWKEALISRVETRVGDPPIELPRSTEWRDETFLDDFEYRPVNLRGRYLQPAGAGDFRRFYAFTVLSSPKGMTGGQGYWAMNLFRTDEGDTLFVNRGFVPLDRLGTEAPPREGDVELHGLMRRPVPANPFTPDCDLEKAVCYSRDIAHAASLAGVDGVAPFFVDLAASYTAPTGAPQAGETRLRFSNSHLQYAVTWFGLSVTLVAVAVLYLRSRRRGARG